MRFKVGLLLLGGCAALLALSIPAFSRPLPQQQLPARPPLPMAKPKDLTQHAAPAVRERAPVRFATACGLALALLGVASGSTIYGTGYAEAHALVQSTADAPAAFGLFKLAANILSYWAGIPGGIFSPALAVGAGMGHTLATWLPSIDASAVVLLGMAAFLAGVTQAPLTAAVISLELTANQGMVVAIMATCLVARAISTLVQPQPIYRALAERVVAEYERDREATIDTPEDKSR